MIGKELGHHRILGRLGAGAMGEVYLAEDTRLGRKVALKLLPAEMADRPERLTRFRREAEAIASLNHPNIVTIYSIDQAALGTTPGSAADAASSGGTAAASTDPDAQVHFLTMELVEGKTLDEIMPAEGLPPEHLLRLATELAAALGAAHRRGIVHRDLKPRNIMLDDEGRAKVLDFGLAKLRRGDLGDHPPSADTETMTEAGTVLGTAPYMSPEQIRGEPADHRSDLFSLGIVLYEAATGERPFGGHGRAELMTAILRDRPEPLAARRPDLPPGFHRAVEGCLEKEALLRLQSCEELLSRLREPRAATGRRSAGDSVAVLPFTDMSAERDQAYFCEGIADEIINALVRIEGLQVVSRTSSFQFQDAGLDIRESGRRLGVGKVLEGSVRRAGDRLRVSAQLVDVASGYHLWSERFDRERKDVFAIQDEIAERTVEMLRGVLSERERRSLKATTEDHQAYDLYLRGRQRFYAGGERPTAEARQLFSRAIEVDADYAAAWAGLADCCSFLALYYDGGEAEQREAEEASRRAVRLAPELAEAHASRGLALSVERDYVAAENEFEAALKLNPNLFEVLYLYARVAFVRGKYEASIELFQRASEVRPEDFQTLSLLSKALRCLGLAAEARPTEERALTLADHRLELHPDDARALAVRACALVELGMTEPGLESAARAQEVSPDDSMLYYVACAYARAGKTERAIDCLEETVAAGWSHWDWLAQDRDLDLIRGHERFPGRD